MRLFVVMLVAACGTSAKPAPPTGGVGNAGSGTPSSDAAPADADDCTLDRTAITGKLIHGATGGKTITAPAAVERHVSEAIELADGTRVYFSLGGCAHYAWELTYELPATTVSADVELRLDALEALLRRTPMVDDLAADMATKIRGRSRTAPRPAAGPWSIECGDANCDANAVIDGSVLRLSVSYDFPL